MLPFHRPSQRHTEKEYLLQALEEGYWGGRTWTAHLEKALQDFFGREAVVVSSGTAALHLAFELLLNGQGGEVLVPTWTFTATASEVVHAGGTPVLVDVGPTLHLTPETLEPCLTPHTRGVVVIHYAGEPAPLREIQAFCAAHNLWLVEDACHALPAWYEGQLCGTFGDIATFSFHATKPVAAGQGGALLFRDPALAEKARRLRQHGIARHPDYPWLYEVETLGWNYMLSDFQAAVALAQLERAYETRRARQALAEAYRTALQTHPELRLYPVQDPSQCGWHLFPVFWTGASVAQRNALLETLRQEGIALSLHYKPLHLHRAYQPYVRRGQRFPTADQAWAEIFSLPLWPDMPLTALQTVVEKLTQALVRLGKNR